MKKVKNYLKECVAIATGNTNEAIALKNKRLLSAELTAQISNLEGELVSLEVNLENAKDSSYQTLLNNGKEITNRQSAVQDLIICKNNEQACQDDLDACKDLIKFLKEKLEEVNADEK